jgi:hypothetical protein
MPVPAVSHPDILTEVDVLARLRDGGLSNADVAAVRRRLIDP